MYMKVCFKMYKSSFLEKNVCMTCTDMYFNKKNLVTVSSVKTNCVKEFFFNNCVKFFSYRYIMYNSCFCRRNCLKDFVWKKKFV